MQMPISLITGPANAGKAELVLDAVRAHAAREHDPLLIVPTRADVGHYLRELAGEAVAMGLRVERFAGLSSEIVRRAGVGEAVLGGLAHERLLRSLAERELGVAAGAGFVRALSQLLGELRTRRVSPARLVSALDAWLQADGPGAARVELGRLYMRYDAELKRLARLDSEQRIVRALDALRERPALWGGTPVLFYGFDDLTRLQLDAIETLGQVVDAPVTVSLAYEPGRSAFAGRAATFQALAPLAREHRQLRARAEHYAPAARTALSHLERSLFEPGAARVGSGSAVRLLEGGGERAELELVAREIALLLAQGMAAEDIAVLVRPAGTAVELLEEVFADAAIPFTLQRRRPFADAAIGGALCGLLRCVPPPAGDTAGELGDLLAWLRAPGLLDVPALADALELRARRAGALSAARARSLWEERHWRLQTIDHLHEAQERGPAALLDRASRELYGLFCAPRRRAAELLGPDELDEASALGAGRRALAQLRELAQLAPELAPATASELAEALAGVEMLSGDGRSPGAVAVLDPLALRARRVRSLFVCGMQEGVFPARARAQPLLTEEERRRLAEVSGLRLGEHENRSQIGQLEAERYLLYAAVSRPQQQLVLSWHSSDDDGQNTPRSLFVDDVCDLFEQSLFAARERRALGAVDPPGALDAPGALDTPGALDGGMPAARRRDGGEAPGRPDEPLHDARLLRELAARPWSASSMERWIGCPVAWFVERLLRPDALEPDPEPLAAGALRHAALEDTLQALRRESGSARLTRGNLARARELLADALRANEAAHPLSVAPERRAAVRRRMQADLGRYLDLAAESESPLSPRELELGFGFEEGDERGDASELPAFELGDGVRLRGRIDRIDVDDAGAAVIYDYKGKTVSGASKWIDDGKLQVALYMRAAEELLGLRIIGGFYQPLSGSDLRPRGVLDSDSGVELDCVSTDFREHSQLRELLDEAVGAAREVAEQASAGRLQARPDSCAFRGGCQYPTICRCER
jgi:ATP-dependent helicase/DNAse subunit B